MVGSYASTVAASTEPPAARPRLSVVSAIEADQYSKALDGFALDVVRTGPGFGPNLVRNAHVSGALVAAGLIQFPVLGRTSVAEDTVVAVTITTAPPGSRWCGIDLAAGTTLLYGPGAEHTGISLAGLAYSLVAVPTAAIRTTAGQRRTHVRLPALGTVSVVPPTAQGRRLAATLRRGGSLTAALAPGMGEDVVTSLVENLALSSRRLRGGTGVQSSRHIVRLSVELSDSLGRAPTLGELCGATHTSERRLRHAFTETLGEPPGRYFRHRALNQARSRLLDETSLGSVTRVAADLGYTNHGRFASQYQDLFGELPSRTAAAARYPRRSPS